MIRKLVFAALAMAALTACETAKGVGRDISKAGQALENAAQ